MGTLSNLPLSLPLPLRFHHFSYPQTQISNPILPSRICPNSLRSNGSSKRIVVFGRNSSEPLESQFFDENGAVDNMDGYLNYLSLEYDSVWDTKPSWCQPWTITLTGVSAIGCSWLVFHSVLVTTIVSVLICTWWYIFLYSYPKGYSDMIEERRKRVTSGVEDTFGSTTTN